MSKYYCTFWYPTIFLTKAEKINRKPITELIDDDSPHTFEITLTIDDFENIAIRTIITEKEKNGKNIHARVEFELSLKKIAKRSNGFIQYEFDFELSEDVCNNIRNLTEFTNHDDPINKFREYFKETLSKPIYHHIKEFYHKHENITGKDSALIAFCFEEGCDYIPLDDTSNSNDNKYLQRFLNNFTDVFKDKAYHASGLNCKLKDIFEKLKEDYGSNKKSKEIEIKSLETEDFNKIPEDDIEKFVKYIQDLDELCEDTLIEYVYCKTLLCSIYNKYYRHDTEAKLEQRDDEISKIECKIQELQQWQQDVESLEQDKKQKTDELEKLKELRRNALNIRNAVRYIENIKYKNQNRKYMVSRILLAKVQKTNSSIENQTTSINDVLKKSDKISNVSLTIAILGIVLTILSIFQTQLQGINLCSSNLYNGILVIVALVSIIALIFFSFRNRSNNP